MNLARHVEGDGRSVECFGSVADRAIEPKESFRCIEFVCRVGLSMMIFLLKILAAGAQFFDPSCVYYLRDINPESRGNS